MGPDIRLFPASLLVIGAQLAVGYHLRLSSWLWVLSAAYVVCGSFSLLLFNLQHECQHRNVFGYKWRWFDDALAWCLGAPGLIPYRFGRRQKHLLHHRHLGDPTLDADRPSERQVKQSRTLCGKLRQLVAAPFRSRLRQLLTVAGAWQTILLVSACLQLAGWRTAVYLLLSPLLGRTLHPFGAALLCSHSYQPDGKALTYSYRGPLNLVFLNAGYHIEHHDFPNVPATRLPYLTSEAAEFYYEQPEVSSWFTCMITYITDHQLDLTSRRDNQ